MDMKLVNFIYLSFCISLMLLREWRSIIWWVIGIISLNLMRVIIWEFDNIKFVIFNSIIGTLSFIFVFVAIAVLMSAYYVYSSPALQAEMHLRTFRPAQAAKRYFGTGGRPK